MIFYGIVRNTLRECLRNPAYFVILLASLFLIGLFPSMSLFVFNEQIKMVVDSSMSSILFFGFTTAVFLSSNIIYREIAGGTLLLLASKPVPRWVFIPAKIFGIILAMTLFVIICSFAVLISISIAENQFELDYTVFYLYYGTLFLSAAIGGAINYIWHKSFASSAVFSFALTLLCLLVYVVLKRNNPVQGTLIPALFLLVMASWIMGSISVMLSSRFDIMTNLIICSVIFFTGLVSDYLFLSRSEHNIFFTILYAAVPNWQFFWMADALAGNKIIPLIYLGWSFLYTLLYLSLITLISIVLFLNVEVAGSSGTRM